MTGQYWAGFVVGVLVAYGLLTAVVILWWIWAKQDEQPQPSTEDWGNSEIS